MLLLGVVLVVVGLVFATNLGRAADFMAASARPFPGWMRAPYSDRPGYYRVFGFFFVVAGLVCCAVGVRG